jgi:hypothetical protein
VAISFDFLLRLADIISSLIFSPLSPFSRHFSPFRWSPSPFRQISRFRFFAFAAFRHYFHFLSMSFIFSLFAG